MSKLLWVFKHQLFDLLRIVGLRDRLRCPECKAVGTWKPHSGWLDREDVRKVRRWLCKYCGHYESELEGVRQCVPSVDHSKWIFEEEASLTALSYESRPPRNVIKRELGRIWPWRG